MGQPIKPRRTAAVSPIRQTRQSRQVVDPFVVARPAAPATTGPSSKPPVGGQSPDIRPARPYRPPAGPLHMLYQSAKPSPVSRPAPIAKPRPPRLSPIAGQLPISSHAAPSARPQPAARRPAGPSMDGVRPQQAKPVAVSARATSAVDTSLRRSAAHGLRQRVAARRPWSFEEEETWRQKPGKVVFLAVCGLLLGALSLFSLELGQLAVAIYGVVALWRRWPSRQAFALALGMFGGIIVTSLVGAWQTLADNLAVYAFLLLCVGTLLMWLEVRRDSRRKTA